MFSLSFGISRVRAGKMSERKAVRKILLVKKKWARE